MNKHTKTELEDFALWLFAMAVALIAGLAIGIVWERNAHGAEVEVTANVGYHIWSQTGHTFIRSDVHDKEFNGWCAQLEGSNWWDRWGVYAYVGMDEGVRQEIFPDWDYYPINI